MQHTLVTATPTVSASSAYTAGDQVGDTMTLSGAVPANGAGAVLRQVVVVDKAKQKAALNVWLFDSSPTIASSDNAAFDLTDAQAAAKCIGVVVIAASDYADSSSNSVATKAVTALVKASGSSTIYAVASTSGTPTYASTSDLVFKFHFTIDG